MISGSTITGKSSIQEALRYIDVDINLQGHRIKGSGLPIDANDLTTKAYVLSNGGSGLESIVALNELNQTLPLTGDLNFLSTGDNPQNKKILVENPIANKHVANKQYTDNLVTTEQQRAILAENNLQSQITQNSNDIDVLDARSLQSTFDTNPSDLNLQNSGKFIYIDDLNQTATSKQITNKAYVDLQDSYLQTQIDQQSSKTLQQIHTTNNADLDMGSKKLTLRQDQDEIQITDYEPTPWYLTNQITSGLDTDIQAEVTRATNAETNLQNNKMEANIPLSSINRPNASLNLDNQKIINLAPATLSTDAINKQQLDSVQTTLQTNIDGKLSNSTTIHDLPITTTFGLGNHDLTMDGTLYTTNLDATLVNCDNLICANARSSNNVGDIFATENKVTQDINTESTRIQGLINNLDNNLQTQIDGKLATTTKLNQIVIPNDQVNMNNNRIINLFDPASQQDAATKNYVDSAISSAISGGTTNQTLQQIQTANPISANLDLGSYGVTTTQSSFSNNDLVTKSYVNSVIPQSSAFEYLLLTCVNNFPAVGSNFNNTHWNIRRQQTNTLISYDTNTGYFTLQPGLYRMGIGYNTNNAQTVNISCINDITSNKLCQDVLGITPSPSVIYDPWYVEMKYFTAGGWRTQQNPIVFQVTSAVRVRFNLTNQAFSNYSLFYVNLETVMPNSVSFNTASSDINMNSFTLNNLADPTSNQQPVTLAYFNNNLASASSTFNSNINMQNLYKVTNLANGSVSSDSCAYGQLTSAISGLSSTYMPLTYRLDQITVPTASINLNNQRITNLGNPQANGDAVNVLHLNTNFYPITGSVQRIRLNANTGSLIAQFPTNTSFTISRQSQTGNYMILSSADHSLEQSHDSFTKIGFTSGSTLKKLTDTAEFQTRPLWLSSSTSVSRDARLYVSRPSGATQSRLVTFQDAGVGGSYNDGGLYADCYSEFNRNVQINGNFQSISYSILGNWLGGQASQAKLLVANNNSTDQLSIETEGHIYSNGNVYADNFVTIVPVSMREYKKEIVPVYNEDLHDVEMLFFKYDHAKLEQDGFPALDRLPEENQLQTGFCLDNVPSRYHRRINQQFSTIENINQLKDELLAFLMQQNRIKSQKITDLETKCSDYEQRLRQLEAVVFGQMQ